MCTEKYRFLSPSLSVLRRIVNSVYGGILDVNSGAGHFLVRARLLNCWRARVFLADSHPRIPSQQYTLKAESY